MGKVKKKKGKTEWKHAQTHTMDFGSSNEVNMKKKIDKNLKQLVIYQIFSHFQVIRRLN